MCGKSIFLISIVLALGLAGGVAQAQVAAADLLVDLRATDLEYGTGSTTWPNRGLLDDFTAQGSPVVEDVDGKKAVTFDASSWFDGPTSVPEIEGAGTRTIEVWAYNPSIVGEETMVSWAHRGGPGGTNMAFNYSDNTSWGSVGHWGAAADMGYAGANSPAPAVGNWWHLVYTYDGTTARIYVNAVEETVKEVALNTHAGNIIRIGAQGDGSGANIQSGMNFIGSIAEVRIYSRALSQVEIEAAMQGMEAYPYALGPDPKDGAMLEATWITLRWHPGDLAVSHDVYLGDNFDDVNNGTADTFQGNQVDTMLVAGFSGFAFPDGLVPGTTYYWRIDEVNDADPNSPWKGDIWSFWVPPKKAYEAVPADKAQFVLSDVTLQWTAGFDAKLHTVYFGDNFDEVSNASGGVAQTATTFAPGVLEPDKTYYWRVDEFDPPATHKGDVWSFTTVPEIPIADPNLVGWWRLDEGGGITAIDWSGYDNNGTFEGNPQWVDELAERGLELNGTTDYVDCGSDSSLDITEEISIAAWVKVDVFGDWDGIVTKGTTQSPYAMQIWGDGALRFTANWGDPAGGVGSGSWNTNAKMSAGGWTHAAIVYDGSVLRFYINGQKDSLEVSEALTFGTAAQSLVLGCDLPGGDEYFDGVIRDVRLYNKALTQQEVVMAMRGDPLLAWSPSPAAGSTPDINSALPLTWSPGDNASQHDVYFGTDKAAVDGADASDTTGVYKGRQSGTSYTHGESLEWGGGPYFWRIDQVNADGSISTGRTWSFTVADFLLVDDFEGYTDNDAENEAIWQHWIDGFDVAANGSQVGNLIPPYAEQTIVHGGRQSMPFIYNNVAGVTDSRAMLALTSGRDWTRQSVTVLSLWFRGQPASANAAEPLYVAIASSGGAPAVVIHGDSNAANIDRWTEWRIDLSKFANKGVNLSDVGSITIGLGSGSGMASAGGSGEVFIDDIRLYR